MYVQARRSGSDSTTAAMAGLGWVGRRPTSAASLTTAITSNTSTEPASASVTGSVPWRSRGTGISADLRLSGQIPHPSTGRVESDRIR